MNVPIAAPLADHLPAPTGTPRRRFHRSTFIFVLLVFLVLVVLNFRPRPVLELNMDPVNPVGCLVGGAFMFEQLQARGWPTTCLWKAVDVGSVDLVYPAGSVALESVTTRRSSLPLLLADLAMGLAVLLLSGGAIEVWRRRRAHLWQFSLRELLLGVTLLMIAVGTIGQELAQSRAEYNAIERYPAARTSGDAPHVTSASVLLTEPTSIGWLQPYVSAMPDWASERIVGISVSGDCLAAAAPFRRVRAIDIEPFDASNKDLALLERCSELESLAMPSVQLCESEHTFVDKDGVPSMQYFRLPRLPRLRALNVSGAQFRGDGLETLIGLEVLDASSCLIDDAAASRLANMHSLRVLSLDFTKITDAAVPVLKQLGGLQYLGISGTAITDAGAMELRQALPNCEILY